MPALEHSSYIVGFVVGLLRNPIVYSLGPVLPTAPILGVAPSFSPLVSSLVQAFVPGLAGLPGADLTVPLLLLLLLISLGVPSACLLLKNMFDPKLEMEPDFDSEIKEDVQGECSKFGSLNPIYKEKYIEFFDAMSVPIAIALSGQPLLGQAVMVKNHPKLEKKLVQSTISAAVAVAVAGPPPQPPPPIQGELESIMLVICISTCKKTSFIRHHKEKKEEVAEPEADPE
ncbi:splicing factor, CC1-like protein [Actinidia rufa]|uniref:Splicing factor, CC1-like protein n=1 Tax=Actinidia rufa TaxID=165716 RepID=A0A7J0EH67_9ERIC|nr:splicing factor, CC1-like protein [Actinidia rufa]